MNSMLFLAITFVFAAYLCGSIPMGYVFARLWGVDVLQIGSGRTGGTNVLRAAGLLPATLTILGDALKGLLPTYFAVLLFDSMPWVAPLVATAAVLGHNYSIFLKFRGGAGGVTALGALSGLAFIPALISVAVAIALIAGTRYASVGTFGGALTGLITLIVFAIFRLSDPFYIIYGVLVVVIIGWGLRPNFVRIRQGTERRIGSS